MLLEKDITKLGRLISLLSFLAIFLPNTMYPSFNKVTQFSAVTGALKTNSSPIINNMTFAKKLHISLRIRITGNVHIAYRRHHYTSWVVSTAAGYASSKFLPWECSASGRSGCDGCYLYWSNSVSCPRGFYTSDK